MQPVLQHRSPHHSFHLTFAGLVGEPSVRMGKTILQAKLPDPPEPGLRGQGGRGVDAAGMLGKDVVTIMQSA